MLVTVFLVALFQCTILASVSDDLSLWSQFPVKEDVGTRLILTPYIEEKMLQKARSLAAVNYGPFRDGIPSYSGFFTVNKRFNSNLFFWFFPAENDYENAPVVLWLQGGPGTSSLFGLFTEIGPFSVAKDSATLVDNPYSWHKNHSLIFIDNPVGTGFSFTDFSTGLATNQTQIGEELYNALIQFFTLFSELRSLPFFIAGESYAGKYIPTLGYTIHRKNPTAKLKINLKGIAVGNGWTDPVNMMDMSSFLYQLGFIDNNIRDVMHELEEEVIRSIEKEDYEKAYMVRGHIRQYFMAFTDYQNMYNFLVQNYDLDFRYGQFVQQKLIRRALHVGDVTFSDHNTNVYLRLSRDLMKSVRPSLEELLENYRVLYYSGQLDLVVAYPLLVNMFNKLEFSAAEEYRNATRVPWYVDGELAGYMKSGGNFTEVLVRNAGHMVPADQPKWALHLMITFIKDQFEYPESEFYQNDRRHRTVIKAFENMYNILQDKESALLEVYSDYVQKNNVRKALHVGDAPYESQENEVFEKLTSDLMQSARPHLEEILEHYRVLYYSGQLDIIVAYPLSKNMFSKLQFSAAEEYHNATRIPWYVNGQLAGYMKSAGKFTDILVRNAGHSVPSDQPKWALEMFTNFTRNELLYDPPIRTIHRNRKWRHW